MNTPHLADPAGAGAFSRYRRECVLLVLLISVQFTFTLFVTVPGFISVDEGTYHMMVKNFSRSGTLEIWNGYEEFPSIELQAASHVRTHNGRLVSQYPYLMPFSLRRSIGSPGAVVFSSSTRLPFL